jgi:hypothetical protein
MLTLMMRSNSSSLLSSNGRIFAIDTGIVEGGVEPPVAVDGLLDHSRHLSLVRDVAANGERLRPPMLSSLAAARTPS